MPPNATFYILSLFAVAQQLLRSAQAGQLPLGAMAGVHDRLSASNVNVDAFAVCTIRQPMAKTSPAKAPASPVPRCSPTPLSVRGGAPSSQAFSFSFS